MLAVLLTAGLELRRARWQRCFWMDRTTAHFSRRAARWRFSTTKTTARTAGKTCSRRGKRRGGKQPTGRFGESSVGMGTGIRTTAKGENVARVLTDTIQKCCVQHGCWELHNTTTQEKEIGGDNAMTEFPNYLTDPEEPQHDDSCQWKEFVPAASVVISGVDR